MSLKAFNTFNVDAKATSFLRLDNLEVLSSLLPEIQAFSNRLVVGSGSNILFVGDYSGLVLHPDFRGEEVLNEDHESVKIAVGAGENWHQFVCRMTARGYFGLENLALIPGTVGAAPVQNIGAYGVEVKQLIDSVETVDLKSSEIKVWSNAECQFAYRDSVFKRAGQGRYIVSRVIFKLHKIPNLSLDYQPLADWQLEQVKVTPQQVLDKVCDIRREKLPDPEILANAGSFFKNPIVDALTYARLKKAFPGIIAFPTGNDFKLAAGWLIEHAGLKGYRAGDVGTHRHQALVIVNYANASGKAIWQLAQKIQQTVRQIYDVELEPEVRIEGLSK